MPLLLPPPEQTKDDLADFPALDPGTKAKLKATFSRPTLDQDEAFRTLNNLPVDENTKADLWDKLFLKIKPAATGMGEVREAIPSMLPPITGMGEVKAKEPKALPSLPPDSAPILNSRQKQRMAQTPHVPISDFTVATSTAPSADGPHVQIKDVAPQVSPVAAMGTVPHPQLPPTPDVSPVQRAKNIGVNLAASLVSAVPSVNASIANVVTAVAENVKSLTAKLGIPTDERLTPYLKNYAKEQESIASALVPESEGLMSSGIYGGVQSLGQNLLMLPFGLGMEEAAAEKAVLTAMGFSTAGQAYGQAREQGVTPGAAAIMAVSQGAIEVATEKIPVHRFMEGFRTGSTFSKMLTSQLAAEIPGEEVATILQDLNEWSVLPQNRQKTFGDYLRERPSAAAETAISTIVGSAGQAGAARILNKVMGGSTTMEQPPVVPTVSTQGRTAGMGAARAALDARQGLPTPPQEVAPTIPPNLVGISGDHGVYSDGTTVQLNPTAARILRTYAKEWTGKDILALQQAVAQANAPRQLPPMPGEVQPVSAEPVPQAIQETMSQEPQAVTVREGEVQNTIPAADVTGTGGDSTIAGELPPKPLGTAEEPQVIKADAGTKELGHRWTIGEHDLSDFGEDWMPVAYLDGQNPEDANAVIGRKGDEFRVETRDGRTFGPFSDTTLKTLTGPRGQSFTGLELAAAAAENAVKQTEATPAPLGQPKAELPAAPAGSLHQPIIKDVYTPEAPPTAPFEKPVTVTDNSVRDHPQQVKITGDTITINHKVGRQKAGTATIPLSEWMKAERGPTANPAYNKHVLLNKYFSGLDDEPGGPEQAERIRDSIGRAIDKAINQRNADILTQGGRGGKLPGTPAATPPQFKGGERVTAAEGTGSVRQVSGSDVKLTLDDGTVTKWIPSRRVTLATPEAEKPPLTPGQQLVQGGRGAKLPEVPKAELPATPEATGPKYSVRPRPDGKFEVLKPNGQPVRMAPFASQAAAQTEAAKQQAKFDEMTGATPAPKELPAPPAEPVAQEPEKPKGKFKFEVQADNTGTWSSNSLTYDSAEEAQAAADDLKSRWFAVTNTRVVPVAELPATPKEEPKAEPKAAEPEFKLTAPEPKKDSPQISAFRADIEKRSKDWETRAGNPSLRKEEAQFIRLAADHLIEDSPNFSDEYGPRESIEKFSPVTLIDKRDQEDLADFVVEHWERAEEEAKPEESAPKTPISTLAFRVRDAIKAGQSIDNPTLTKWAVEAFGGTRGEGKYDLKMAYDAAEAGINMAIREPGVVDFNDVPGTLKRLRELVSRMPTQADRTAEQTQLQQFSTPPEEAFAATLAAAIKPDMVMMEPSAGNGGIAIMAEAAGAKVITNELSARRKQILESLGFPAHSVDAEHLDALLDPSVRPDVVIMNPPFSSSAKGKSNKTEHGAKHVTQALLRLKEGGRLVAIVGRGMAHGRPGFAEWWDKLEQKYTVRANIGIDGKYYQKYGTGFDNQIIVIDKTGPTPGKTRSERLANIVRSENLSPEQAIEILTPLSKEDVRGRIEQASGRPTESAIRNPSSEGRKPATTSDIEGAPRGEREHPTSGEQPGTKPGGVGELGATPERQPGPLGDRGGETGGGRLPGTGGSGLPGGLGSQPGVAGSGQSERVGGGRPGLTPPPAQTNAEAIGSVLDGPVSQDTIKGLKQGLQSGPRKKSTGNASRAIPKSTATEKRTIPAGAKTGKWFASMTPPPAEYGSESITDLDPADQLSLLQFGAAQFKTTPDYDAWTAKMQSELGADWAPYLPTAFDLIEAVAEAKGFKPEETPVSPEEKPEPKEEGENKPEEDEGVFSPYKVRKAKFDKSVPHPAHMVESATMASVEPPDVTYKPTLPEEVIQEGRLSDVQLEAITYAGQRHQTKLPNGQTAGFWIGDGTGVGKGRTASGIILDNLMKGKKRALWLSIGQQLSVDAERDLKGVGVPLPLLKQQDTKMADAIPDKDGVLFSTYGMAAANWKQNARERFHQIVNWLGPDFDGVIILDEGHKMKGAVGTTVGGAVTAKTGTDAGAMGLALSKAFPNAKIVYVSATGATVARNMAYMDRLGLWGPGAPFNTFMDFLGAIDSGGVGAMEMLARDLKATGAYISRTLSFKGVDYDTVVHTLTPEETDQYKGMADFWSELSNQFETAMANANQPRSDGRKMSQFYSTQQRFFLQVMTSLQLPEMFRHAEKDLADGKSIIISLINTNEGHVKNKVLQAIAAGEDIADLDFTPRDMMAKLIQDSFPLQEFETVHNPLTGQDEQVAMWHPDGKPVINPENQAMQDAMLAKLADMSVPDNPIDAIVAHFGPKNVSEISGRKKRMEHGKWVGRKIEGVKMQDRDAAEIKRFQDGITRVAIITSKGSTGISLHADKGAKNKQRRVMYAMQLSWSADQQMQTTPGRAHRAFQESAPQLKLFRTNLSGQERLVNTVSARLASLGAISKGGRETLGGGLFGVHDLTDKYGGAALIKTYRELQFGMVKGATNGTDILHRMGMLNSDGVIKNGTEDDVDRFLNRIMSLPVNEQNSVFNAFFDNYQQAVEKAKESGEFDLGVHKLEGENFRTTSPTETVYTHPESAAKTQLVNLEGEMPLHPISFPNASLSWRSDNGFFVNNRSGKLYATRVDKSENPAAPGWYVRLTAPTGNEHTVHVTSLQEFNEKHSELRGKDLEKRWTEEYSKAPKFETAPVHLLTGAIYPIYNKVMGDRGVGQTRKVVRATLKNGQSFVGLKVDPSVITALKERLGIGTALGTATGKQIYDMVRGGSVVQLDNGWRIKGAKVRGESRIEVSAATGVPNPEEMKRHGTIEEILDHKRRFFVPTSEDGPKVIDSILKLHAAVKDETSRGGAGQTSAMKSAAPVEEAPPPPLGKGNAMAAAPRLGLPEAPKSKLESAAEAFRKLGDTAKNILAPGTRGLPAEMAAPVIRKMASWRDTHKAQAEEALAKAYKYFKGRPKEEGHRWIAAIEDDDIDSLPPEEQEFAKIVRDWLDTAWEEVRKRNGIKSLIEGYFPHLWENPNKASEAIRSGQIYGGKRPLEGRKKFLKKRSIATFQEGLDAGLVPKFDNPIDMVLHQLDQEMKFITAHDAKEELKALGVLRFKSVFDDKFNTTGMAQINDPMGTVYGSPTVTVKEAYDEVMFDKLNEFAKSLGVDHFRKVNIGKAGGAGESWGWANTNRADGAPDRIWSKVGGPETVITHEIGHVLDHRYGLQARLDPFNDELDNLAAERYRDKKVPQDYMDYVKEPSERIANLIHAMVHAPNLAEEIAPKATAEMKEFLAENPELEPLLDIQPSLVLGSAQHKMGVGGMVVRGHYWAPESAATLINNYLSPGLSGYRGYRIYRAIGNTLNQVQLGLSGFHLTFTAMDAAISKGALGLQQVTQGVRDRDFSKMREGTKNLILGNIVTAPWLTYMKGSKVLKEAYAPGSQGEFYAKVFDDLIKGGGRLKMESFYKNSAIAKFWDAWGAGKYATAGVRSLFALMEYSGKPLMEHWVPRLKLGVFADLSQQMLSELSEDATDMERAQVLGRAWDSVDNRMGQLVYDNLFWNKATKDIGMGMVRSLGWNLGTWRELGGAGVDVAKGVVGKGNMWSGGKFKLPPRVAYALYMTATVMVMGAFYQYLRTGEWPEELKDYFFPKTGQKLPDGEAERVSLPSYAKDIYAYGHGASHGVEEMSEGKLRKGAWDAATGLSRTASTTIGHKVHPEITMLLQAWQNKDFFGTEIRHEGDPDLDQIKDVMKFVGEQYVPFSLRNMKQRVGKDSDEGLMGAAKGTVKGLIAHPGQAAESFFGVTPAPKSLSETPAERMASDYMEAAMPKGERTKSQFQRSQTRSQITREFNAKDPKARTDLQSAIKDGKLTQSDLDAIKWSTGMSAPPGTPQRAKEPLERMLRSANLEQVLNVFDVASTTEKALLVPLIRTRVYSKALLPAERKKLLPKALDAMKFRRGLSRAPGLPAPPPN